MATSLQGQGPQSHSKQLQSLSLIKYQPTQRQERPLSSWISVPLWHSLGNLNQRTERRRKLCIMGLISAFPRITGNPIDHCQGIEIRTLEADRAQFKASVSSYCPWLGCCPSPVSSWMDNCLHGGVIRARQTGVPQWHNHINESLTIRDFGLHSKLKSFLVWQDFLT